MRATVDLDEELLAKAQELTAIADISAICEMALQALVERESARRLVQIGGAEPRLQAPQRRRWEDQNSG